MTRRALHISLRTLLLLLALMAFTLTLTQMAQAGSSRRQLTYFSQRYRDSRINLVDIERGLTMTLLRAEGLVTRIIWSPDGERIAFNVYTPAGFYELRLMELGRRETDVLNQQWASHRDLGWSPDGRYIAFTHREDGQAQVFIVDTANATVNPLAVDLMNTSGPSWSPDGTQLAFAGQGFSGESEIFAQEVACLEGGCPPRRLTGSPAIDHMPAWSPDGTRIAFVSNRDAVPAVYIMEAACNPSSCLPRRVNTMHVTSEAPVWSPDSRWLVVSVDTATNSIESTLQLVDLESGAMYRITTERSALNVIDWSPDSRTVAYIVDFMNVMDVMVKDVACIVASNTCASESYRVTQHDANVWSPVWRP